MNPEIRSRYFPLVIRIIHLTLLAALVLYALLGLFAFRTGAPATTLTGSEMEAIEEFHAATPEKAPLLPITIPFAVVAIINIAIAFFVKRKFVDAPLEAGKLDLRQAEHAGRYFVVHVIAFALAEAAGVFGLVLRIIGESTSVFLLFITVAIVALFMLAPNQIADPSDA